MAFSLSYFGMAPRARTVSGLDIGIDPAARRPVARFAKRRTITMQKPNEVSRLGRTLRIFLIAGSTVFLGQAQDPQNTNSNRTVGPQKDGSVVASDNQTLTPAGKIIELGSPVRAKAVALNPSVKTNTGAVLLMGSPQ